MTTQTIKYDSQLFFRRAMKVQRRQLLSVMADAVSECRTVQHMAAELSGDGETVGIPPHFLNRFQISMV